MDISVPLRQDGRVVIPYAIREALELEAGDLVALDVQRVEEGGRND